MKLLIYLYFGSLALLGVAQSHSSGTTFSVDNVQQNSLPLAQTDYSIIVQNKLMQPIFVAPKDHLSKQIAPVYGNGFIATVHEAYNDHRPLVITPDDIWLLLCQGLGHHVAANSDSLAPSLINTNSPNVISVFINDLAKDNQKGWEQLVSAFNDSLKVFVKGDAVATVNQQFSTTTPIILTAYQITLMDAVKTFFSYRAESGCGIPSITLAGTTEDWQKIYDKVDGFNAFGLENWTQELKPILQEFILASNGKPTISFWQRIYKHQTFYGSSELSGWIIKFFPYLKKNTNLEPDVWDRDVAFQTEYYKNPSLKGQQYLLSGISNDAIPKGYVSVPFEWYEIRPDAGDTLLHLLTLHSGFLGIGQKGVSLHPLISWCITKQETKLEDPIMWDWQVKRDTSLQHDAIYWDSEISAVVASKPVFDPSNYLTYEEGMEGFQQHLQQAGFSSHGTSKLKIVVAWDGSIIFRELTGPLVQKEKELRHYLTLLETRWIPATSTKKTNFHEPNAITYTNYIVEIKL